MPAKRVSPISSYLSLRIVFLDGAHPADIELAGVRWVSRRRGGTECIRASPEMLP